MAKPHFKSLIISFLFLSGASNPFSYCQSYIIRNYNTSSGIPHNNVRDIVRDTTGYLWVATWDGLSRFDGYEFRNYYHEVNDTNSLPFFAVKKIEADRNNNLWILTDNQQIAKYNRNSDDFTVLQKIGSHDLAEVSGICSDRDGNIMLLLESQVIMPDNDSRSFNYFNLEDSLGNPYSADQPGQYYHSAIITEKEIWIAGIFNIIRFKKNLSGNRYHKTGEYSLPRKKLQKDIDYDYNIWKDLYMSPTGNIWVFSNEGLFLLKESSNSFEEFESEVPPGELTGKQFFWWGSKDKGVMIYNSSTGRQLTIPVSETEYPMAVFTEDERSVWFSHTTPAGIYRGLNQLVWTPSYFTNELIYGPDQAPAAVYALVEDKNNRIWTGIRGFDRAIIKKDSTVTYAGRLDKERFNLSGHIRTFVPVDTGIWIGYFTKLLRFYEYETGKISDFYPANYGFRAITTSPEGKIIAGGEDLVSFDPETGITDTIWHLEKEPYTIFKLFNLGDSVILGARARSTILRYIPEKRKGSLLQLPGGIVNAEDVITGINDEYWICTLGEGVCRYDPGKNEFRFYSTSDGLSANTTYCLLKDHNGNIWVSTNSGISRINAQTGRIRTFGANEGLKISEFNSGAKLITGNGEFLFGGMGGYVRFYPDSINDSERKANTNKIFLTGLTVSGNIKILPEAPDNADTIILAKGENNLNISFSSTDFLNTDKVCYRYKTTGIDNNWIETGSRSRTINYASIKPGVYNLKIERTDSEGNWGGLKEIVIVSEPFFYETYWFIIIVILSGLAIAGALVNIYIRGIRQKEQIKSNELKLQSLRGQMNPHFIFNSLNSINYFISNNDRMSANRYIADFSRLIRTIISNLGQNYVKFDDEFQSIINYLKIEHLRFSDKFDYEIITKNKEFLSRLEISPGIIQPLVENSIWHGVRPLECRKGTIMITIGFDQKTEKAYCLIEDDGIGIEESERRKDKLNYHQSRGIGLVRERLEISGKLNRKDYRLEFAPVKDNERETGTRVFVEIPVKVK